MAIEDSVLLRTRGIAIRVRVNGVLLTGGGDVPAVLSLEYGDSYDTPPYANVDLNTVPAWMRSGLDIEIDAGINNDVLRQFTGFISALPGEEPEFLRDRIRVEGATIPSGTPPDDVQVPITAAATLVGADIRPPLPSGSHIGARVPNHLIWDATRAALVAQRVLTDRGRVPAHPGGAIDSQTLECHGPLYNLIRQLEFDEDELAVGGMTDQEVIELVLDRVGITNRVITTPPDGWYTLAADATIDGGSAADQLADIMGIAGTSGLQFHQTPSGITVLRFTDFFPAPTAAFSYSTDDPDTAYIVSTDGVTELAVTYNPTITKGMTGQFNIPHLNVDGRYFVYGVRHVIPKPSPSEGPTTYLRLRGGNRLGGTVQVNPVASFTVSVRRQVVGNTLRLIYTLDASDSVALDGTITSYAWTITTGTGASAITTSPAHPLTGKIVTFTVDPADILNSLLEETLTVTGSNGLTHATKIALPNTIGDSAVEIAPFIVGAGTNSFVSPDGGATYNNTATGTVTCVAARPPDGVNSGHFLKGFSNGRIHRSIDFGVTWTEVRAAAVDGIQINDIAWDWRNTNVAWAVNANMKVLISVDAGVTWVTYDDLRAVTYVSGSATASAIAGRRCIGLPGAGGIYVSGGDGAGLPLIAYDPVVGSHGWVHQTFTGDLATDTATPADATMRIVDATAPGDGMAHIILEWASGGGASLVAIYYSTSPPGTSVAYSRATGLTAGLKTGRVILSDAPLAGAFVRRAMFADRSVWQSTNGIAFTETTNVLPVNYTPNDGLFESDVLTGLIGMQGVYLIAAEDAAGNGGVFKSTDGLATLSAIYGAGATYATPTYPVGAKPVRIAMGAPGATSASGDLRVALVKNSGGATTFDVSYLVGVTWATVALPAQIDNTRPRIYCLTTDNWIVVDSAGHPEEAAIPSKATRTIDGGATWVDAAIGDEDTSGTDPLRGFSHVCRAADGRIWAVRYAGNDTGDPIRCHIYYSDNAGSTWTLSSTLAPAGNRRFPYRLIAHPTDGNTIALITANKDSTNKLITHITVNRGSSWTTNQVSSTPTSSEAHALVAKGAVMLSNGRIVWVDTAATFGTNDTFCYTSDDRGATYTLRQTIDNTDHFCILAGAAPSKIVLFQAAAVTITTTMRVWVSTDQGQTYVSVDDTYPVDDAGSDWSAKYDAVTDTLVVMRPEVSGAQRVMAFSPVSSAGVWTDLTFNLPAVASANWDALAVVP